MGKKLCENHNAYHDENICAGRFLRNPNVFLNTFKNGLDKKNYITSGRI